MKKYLFYISQNYSFAILRPIQEILIARNDEVFWFFEGSDVTPSYLSKSEKALNTIYDVFNYQPDVVLATANNLPSFIPGLKVAIFHGFDAGKLDNRGKNDHFKIRGGFDLYCTQGPSTTLPFKRIEKKLGFFNVIETGWAALDPLFPSEPNTHRNPKPTILFCSTFSKRLSCAKDAFTEIKRLSKLNKWKWIVQFHPKMDKKIVDQYKSIQNENLSFIETDNIIPLLKEADLMVCDTSSVITMFLIQNKPVITINNIKPSPYLLNISDPSLLEKTIEIALNHPLELMTHIKKFVDQTHPYSDGESSKRVVKAIDDVLDGHFPLTKKKPLNILRNLKYRKRLGYWKFLFF